MVQDSRFQTVSKARQLGNAISWLRNCRLRLARLTAARTQEILFRGMTPQEQQEFDRLLQKALENIQAIREGGSEHER